MDQFGQPYRFGKKLAIYLTKYICNRGQMWNIGLKGDIRVSLQDHYFWGDKESKRGTVPLKWGHMVTLLMNHMHLKCR